MITYKEFENKSDRTFVNISSEDVRIYNLADGREITIENPIALSTNSTSHYVVDGTVRRIPFDATKDVLTWRVAAGKPHVVA